VGVAARAAGSGTGFPAPPAPRFCGSWRTGFRNGCNPRPRTLSGFRPTTSTARWSTIATLFHHRGCREWRHGLARERARRRARPDRPVPIQREISDTRRDRSLEVAKLATRFASAKPATSVVGSWERFFGEQEPAGCGISAFGKWPGVSARIKLAATGSLDEATNQVSWVIRRFRSACVT